MRGGLSTGGTAHTSGASDVNGTAGSSTGAEARTRRYAELLSKQRDVASAHTHLDKVIISIDVLHSHTLSLVAWHRGMHAESEKQVCGYLIVAHARNRLGIVR